MAFSGSDLEAALRENDEQLRAIVAARDQIAQQEGRGKSASGLAEAVVGADGHLKSLRLDRHRVERASPPTIAADVVEAVNRSLDDLQAKANELLRSALPGYSAGGVLAPESRLVKDIEQYSADMKEQLGKALSDLDRLQSRLQGPRGR